MHARAEDLAPEGGSGARGRGRSRIAAACRPGAAFRPTRQSRMAEALSRRRDRKSFLLAAVGDVAHGRALHVAAEAQVVERRAAMHRAAIVPHHEITDAPAVGIDELPLGSVLDELVDQRTALRVAHAEDAAGMGGEIERLATGFRD